jgi:hypothetical protein
VLVAGASTALFLLFVLHPVESAGRSPQRFYQQVRELVGDLPVASYGGMDFSANWMLARDEVQILPSLCRAERYLAHEAKRIWLIGEVRDVERLGVPSRTLEALREPRSLGPDLVLLRAEARPRGSAADACRHPT